MSAVTGSAINAPQPVGTLVRHGLAGFGLDDAGGKAVGIEYGNEQQITSGIAWQRQHRQPPRHRRQISLRPAQAVIQTAQHVKSDGNNSHQEHDEPLGGDFFPAQQPAREQFAIVFVKVGAENNRDDEVHAEERPALPVMPRAGNKQQNDQRCLLNQCPANQSRQEIFGRLIFQSPEIATFAVALPAASRCWRTASMRDAKL